MDDGTEETLALVHKLSKILKLGQGLQLQGLHQAALNTVSAGTSLSVIMLFFFLQVCSG